MVARSRGGGAARTRRSGSISSMSGARPLPALSRSPFRRRRGRRRSARTWTPSGPGSWPAAMASPRSSASPSATCASDAAARSRSSPAPSTGGACPTAAPPGCSSPAADDLCAQAGSSARCRAGADRGGGGHRARRRGGARAARSPATLAAARAGRALRRARRTRWPRWLGARGPVITVSTACASGATALGLGADLLREDEADVVVAGGYDILCRFVHARLRRAPLAHARRVRPFDRRRSGLLLGEAAGARAARARAGRGPAETGTLLGYGSASDASHIAAPDPQGRGTRAGDPGGARPRRGVDGGRRRFRERARHRDACSTTGSRRRRSGACSGARAAQVPGELDQGRARPHHGRGGGARGDHVPRWPPRA